MDMETIHKPKRLPNETFKDYKHRRYLSKKLVKLYMFGTYCWLPKVMGICTNDAKSRAEDIINDYKKGIEYKKEEQKSEYKIIKGK